MRSQTTRSLTATLPAPVAARKRSTNSSWKPLSGSSRTSITAFTFAMKRRPCSIRRSVREKRDEQKTASTSPFSGHLDEPNRVGAALWNQRRCCWKKTVRGWAARPTAKGADRAGEDRGLLPLHPDEGRDPILSVEQRESRGALSAGRDEPIEQGRSRGPCHPRTLDRVGRASGRDGDRYVLVFSRERSSSQRVSPRR